MSGFDELQRQLLESVAGHSRRRLLAWPASRLRERAGSGSRRGLLAVVISLMFVAAAAAATIVSQSGESAADRLVNRILAGTGHSAACRMTGPGKAGLSNEAPDPRLTAVLPELASAPHDPPSAAVVALAERNSGGAVLARTIRVVDVPGGFSLIVYVAHGQGPFTLVDPQRCRGARLERLAQLLPNARDPLRRAVARMLEHMPDTDPGLQSLTIDHREDRPGHPLDGGGASFPLLNSYSTLPTGVLFSGSGCENTGPYHRPRCSPVLYGGIAKRATAYLTLEPATSAPTRARGQRLTRRIGVSQGFFAFTLARNTGPETITQRAQDGKALATEPLFGTGVVSRAGRHAPRISERDKAAAGFR
jgi:hypothetical protein